MKKILSLVLAFAMVLGSFGMAFAAPPSDVVGTDYEDAVEALMTLGIVDGYGDGTVKPLDTIKKEEFAKLMVVALGLEDIATYAAGRTQFSDVPAGNWAEGYINVAVAQGLIKGNPDGTFGFGSKVDFKVALTVLVRALGYDDEGLGGVWPYNYIVKAKDLGVTEDVTITPSSAVRGDVFILLNNSLRIPMVEKDADGNYVENEDKTLLVKVGFDKVTGRMTAKVNSDDEITLTDSDGDTYDVVVPEDFDSEANFGLKLTVWFNSDDEVELYEVKDTPSFDALAWDADDEILTLVEADEDYDVNSDATFYLDGEKAKVADLDGADYAKVVFNSDDEVLFVDAYKWDGSLVVDELDDTTLFGYDNNAAERHYDIEDYVIVKGGNTIAMDDLEEGDLFFYNDDVEYAEVYNDSFIESEIETVYTTDGDFDLDGDNYDIDGTYVDSDGDIDVLSADILDDMKDSEEDAKVLFDREGNVRHVIGEFVEEEDTSVIVGYVITDTGVIGTNARTGEDTYNIDVVTENGEYIEYDVADAVFDLDDDGTVNGTEPAARDAIDAKNLVEITLDEDGDVVLVEEITTGAAITADIDTADDTYATVATGGLKLKDSALVFDVQNYTTDTDDITVSTFGELEYDTIKVDADTLVYADSYARVAYIVVGNSDQAQNLAVAMVKKVKKLSTTKSRVYIIVNGEEMYADMANADMAGAVKGDLVSIDLVDDTFTLESVVASAANDTDKTIKDISLRSETFKLDGFTTTRQFISGGYIFDISGTTPEVIDFDEIAEDAIVDVYTEDSSSRYVEFIVVNSAPKTQAELLEEATTAVVTLEGNHTAGNVTAAETAVGLLDAGTDKTALLARIDVVKVAMANAAYTLTCTDGDTVVVTLDALDAEADFAVIMGGKAYNVVDNMGTLEADVSADTAAGSVYTAKLVKLADLNNTLAELTFIGQ